MKILLFGLLAFITWSAFSDYIYVCRIRGFCIDPVSIQTPALNPGETIITDTTESVPVKKNVVKPEEYKIYFEYNVSELKNPSDAGKYFDLSSEYLEQNENAKIKISGHADAIGSFDFNQTLGLKRAESVQRYLVNKGIKSDRVIIESKGEKEPAGDNSTISGRSINRRTELTINN